MIFFDADEGEILHYVTRRFLGTRYGSRDLVVRVLRIEYES